MNNIIVILLLPQREDEEQEQKRNQRRKKWWRQTETLRMERHVWFCVCWWGVRTAVQEMQREKEVRDGLEEEGGGHGWEAEDGGRRGRGAETNRQDGGSLRGGAASSQDWGGFVHAETDGELVYEPPKYGSMRPYPPFQISASLFLLVSLFLGEERSCSATPSCSPSLKLTQRQLKICSSDSNRQKRCSRRERHACRTDMWL